MHAKESHDHEVFKNNLGISTVLQIRVCHNIYSTKMQPKKFKNLF